MLTVNMVLTDSPGATPGGTVKRLAYSLFNVNNTSKSLIKKLSYYALNKLRRWHKWKNLRIRLNLQKK